MKRYQKLLNDYISHSYRYYVLDNPIVSDVVYDIICSELVLNFDKLDQTKLKELNINKELINSNSGYSINYPKDFKASKNKVIPAHVVYTEKDRQDYISFLESIKDEEGRNKEVILKEIEDQTKEIK